MGRKRKGRQINGILILDKPVGISSNQALQKVKRLFNANKAGHTGNLDVPASGLLPICLGEATKISSYLLNADKTYITEVRLGITTNTGDAAGEVLQQREVNIISQAWLEEVLAEFKGDIKQIPPMFSALKHNGQRLHKLAYQGIEVEREPRPVKIHEIELLLQSETGFKIKVNCSKGTYIRTLVQDIGEKLGCGAHVLTLRRLDSGPFISGQMISLEKLEELAEEDDVEALDSLLLPMDMALFDLPKVECAGEALQSLCHGQAISVLNAPESGRLRIYSDSGEFIGIGTVLKDGRIAPKRLIII